jgi:Leu/Phe-tRNA-protein transferase
MILKYTLSGYLYISPEDNCHAIVDAMLATEYMEDFCIAGNVVTNTEGFDAEFTAKLMEAGFLIMSANLNEENAEPCYIMLPKLHTVRSALFYENLHVKKSIRRLLNKYELKADADFDYIIDRCVQKHGSDWLTPPLVKCIKQIRKNAKTKLSSDQNYNPKHPALFSQTSTPYAYPASFALYRNGEFAAGEFGVVCGNVYTSYSGFYEEHNAGTVQLIHTAWYLQNHGFSFFDLGMPMNYKADLGALDIYPDEFVKLFRGTVINGEIAD